MPGMVAGLVSMLRCLQGILLLTPSKGTEVAHSWEDDQQSHLGTLTFLTPTFQVMGNERTQDISKQEARFCKLSKNVSSGDEIPLWLQAQRNGQC